MEALHLGLSGTEKDNHNCPLYNINNSVHYFKFPPDVSSLMQSPSSDSRHNKKPQCKQQVFLSERVFQDKRYRFLKPVWVCLGNENV